MTNTACICDIATENTWKHRTQTAYSAMYSTNCGVKTSNGYYYNVLLMTTFLVIVATYWHKKHIFLSVSM